MAVSRHIKTSRKFFRSSRGRFQAQLRKASGVAFDLKYYLRLRFSISAAQVLPRLPIKLMPRITGSHRDPNLTHRHPDLRADLQQLRTDRRYLRWAQFSRFQAQPPQPTDPDVGHGR